MMNSIPALSSNPVLFLGEPGTGKTHGVAASSEKLFDTCIHTPLVIQARNIPISSKLERYN